LPFTRDGRWVTDQIVRTAACLANSRPESVRNAIAGKPNMKPALRVRIEMVLREHFGIEVVT
jgi:hypothetical protein